MISFYDTMVIIDLEVSDVEEARSNGTHPEMIDLGAVKIGRDLSIIDTYSQLIKPKNMAFVTDQTTRITGITPEMLEDAPTWDKAWECFCEFTDFNRTRLAAFHALNDHGWLRAAYQKYHLGYPHPGFVFDIASWMYGFCAWYGIKPRSWGLKNCCKRFGVPYEDEYAHRGLYDAQAAYGILAEIQRIEYEHGQPSTGSA